MAAILRNIGKNQYSSHVYNEHFHRFVTSVSWRVMNLQLDYLNRGLIEDQYPACKHWRHYLSGRRGDVAGYSQHAFVVFDQESVMHKILRGYIHPEHGIIFTQAGPLYIIGRLSRSHRDKAESGVWARSEVGDASGTLTRLETWQLNDNIIQEW